METLEYTTCEKCKVQQKAENFRYCSMRHKICKFCNKKTNRFTPEYKTTTKQILDHLNKIMFDPESNVSITLQSQMSVVSDFLSRQHCKEMEAQNG